MPHATKEIEGGQNSGKIELNGIDKIVVALYSSNATLRHLMPPKHRIGSLFEEKRGEGKPQKAPHTPGEVRNVIVDLKWGDRSKGQPLRRL